MPTLAAAQDPDDGTLLRVVRHLDGRGDAIGVVRLVERWAEGAEPPAEARLCEARALLTLRLMDRAWVRLRELTEGAANVPEELQRKALVSMAEMFVERGWPARARKTLARLPEGYAGVPAELRERAKAAPLQPPANARELERSGGEAEILALAERYLATGSVIRGRSLLERLRRDGSRSPRVEQLLRGLRGDFSARGQSLGELVAELCPPGTLTEWDIADHTESVRLADLGTADPPTAELRTLPQERGASAKGAFPSLFRRDPSTDAAGRTSEEAEVTVSSHMASEEELADAPPEEESGEDLARASGSDDTRIMQVIQRGGGGSSLEEVEGPIHKRSNKKDRLRETLDLKAYQESMGMAATPDAEGVGEVDEDFLEEEDQDLVVMTRREGSGSEDEEAPRQRRGPIEVIEKVPVPVVAPRPEAPSVPPAAPAARPRSRALDDEADVPEPSGSSITVLLIAAALFAAVAVIAALLAYRVVVSFASDQVVERVRPALAAGDYRGLLDLEAELEQRVDGGLTPPTAYAEFATVEAVLWSEYTGDERRRERARELLTVARARGARPESVALAELTLALADGDLVAAEAARAALSPEDEAARYLLARRALLAGELDQAGASWTVGEGSGLRYRLLGPELLQAAGEDEAASEALESLAEDARGNALVVVALADRREDGPEEVLELVDPWLTPARTPELGPRQQARLHLARAAALGELGQDEAAVRSTQLARAVDGANPSVRYALGGLALAQNDVLDALTDFDACLEARVGDARCARGAVQALLDLDRIVEAEARVAGWPGDPGDRAVLESWVAVQAGDGVRVELGAVPPVRLAALVPYVRGLADSDVVLLERAAQVLGATRDPLDSVLALRAEAAAALGGEARVSSRELGSLADRGRQDPVVQVLLGRHYERVGREAAAAQHFERAAQIGPQNAFAHHERGLYYYAPPYVRARSAWREYLALEPSGARAERVKQRLALR